MKLTLTGFKTRCAFKRKNKGFNCNFSVVGRSFDTWGQTEAEAMQNMKDFLCDEHGFTIIESVNFSSVAYGK